MEIYIYICIYIYDAAGLRSVLFTTFDFLDDVPWLVEEMQLHRWLLFVASDGPIHIYETETLMLIDLHLENEGA